ncbi:hypothetical protein Fot_35710 [Forsythia ovata]|uniref:Uncharacterized protein n=1 Tax=Forsythia ovata TaxID=205694 RepID=A0ABD1SQA4_9LAMI
MELGLKSSSESDDSSRESPQTEHLEEEQQKSGLDFADENVEEEEESTNEEDDELSAEETVPVRLSRAQKGKQKIDERSNVADFFLNIRTLSILPQMFQLQRLILNCSNKVCSIKVTMSSLI